MKPQPSMPMRTSFRGSGLTFLIAMVWLLSVMTCPRCKVIRVKCGNGTTRSLRIADVTPSRSCTLSSVPFTCQQCAKFSFAQRTDCSQVLALRASTTSGPSGKVVGPRSRIGLLPGLRQVPARPSPGGDGMPRPIAGLEDVERERGELRVDLDVQVDLRVVFRQAAAAIAARSMSPSPSAQFSRASPSAVRMIR